MDLDSNAALEALRTYLYSLSKAKVEPPLTRPEWAYAEAEPVMSYVVRKRLCYAFALVERQGPITGYILDTVGNIAHPVRDGNVQAALMVVGL